MNTPPCPNCGTVYFEGPVDSGGWRSVSIASTVIFESGTDGSTFSGHEFYCTRCRHRWRVAVRSIAEPEDRD